MSGQRLKFWDTCSPKAVYAVWMVFAGRYRPSEDCRVSGLAIDVGTAHWKQLPRGIGLSALAYNLSRG
jgi:hypothetical protein